jgi:hypothetical protein
MRKDKALIDSIHNGAKLWGFQPIEDKYVEAVQKKLLTDSRFRRSFSFGVPTTKEIYQIAEALKNGAQMI